MNDGLACLGTGEVGKGKSLHQVSSLRMADALVLDNRVSEMSESYWITCCHLHYTEEALSPSGPAGQDQELWSREVQHTTQAKR